MIWNETCLSDYCGSEVQPECPILERSMVLVLWVMLERKHIDSCDGTNVNIFLLYIQLITYYLPVCYLLRI